MQKYLKYLTILSVVIMFFGGGLFFIELSNKPEDIHMNVVMEDEGVPLGLWEDEDENKEDILMPYKDIENHWAKESILFVIENEIMSPVSEDCFDPDTLVSRASFITTLGRVENVDVTGRVVQKFKDVDNTKYFAPYVAWAEENNILANEKRNKFRPNDNISREEMAVMLCNYLENVRGEILTAGTTFADYNLISTWARDKVMLVTGSEYISGRQNGLFDPRSGVSRAELATLLARLMQRLEL